MLTNQVSFITCVYALYKHVCHRAYMEDNVQNLFSLSTMWVSEMETINPKILEERFHMVFYKDMMRKWGGGPIG